MHEGERDFGPHCGQDPFWRLVTIASTARRCLFLPPLAEQSYDHEQGRKLLADIEYVISFVNMQRFKDRLLVQVL